MKGRVTQECLPEPLDAKEKKPPKDHKNGGKPLQQLCGEVEITELSYSARESGRMVGAEKPKNNEKEPDKLKTKKQPSSSETTDKELDGAEKPLNKEKKPDRLSDKPPNLPKQLKSSERSQSKSNRSGKRSKKQTKRDEKRSKELPDKDKETNKSAAEPTKGNANKLDIDRTILPRLLI